ncbi:SET domain-containing protein-lysine N-methyltransferase [Moorena sp. SIO2C4]|uniref:SET domain-containing protein-lysine N-methyltransferase n=1 Tax=Moorena sp. SIO2C4 TaxID=2607824 RepID=UPI0013C0D8CD|nr:SET domain-containing protein-lysine N-methyltransferase [Moorena sp. SIO2C4]NEQ14137.1 SET domain-containing protein [Moorena sp. SIO3E2]NES44618.1 SET domain-containing protein [Moorena sp. SIO2C4]
MTERFELRDTPGKGEGMFATDIFKTGEIVMVGRIKQVLSENNSHASQIGKDKYVLHGGMIHKVNHCCDPNCGIHVNETGGHDFVARRDITVGEEITFDYAMRNYSVDFFEITCQCGAEKCRGKITGYKDLPADKKKEYEGLIAPYLLELDA